MFIVMMGVSKVLLRQQSIRCHAKGAKVMSVTLEATSSTRNPKCLDEK